MFEIYKSIAKLNSSFLWDFPRIDESAKLTITKFVSFTEI